MNWATGVPASSTVPRKSTRRHHISVDVPAPATAAAPRSPDSLEAGPQQRIVQRYFKPSGVSSLRFPLHPVPSGHPWMEFVCVTVRHEAAFGQRAQLSPQECRGGARRAKGTHSSTPPSMPPTNEASQATVPYSLAARGAPHSPFRPRGRGSNHPFATKLPYTFIKTNLFPNAHGCN